MLSRSGNVQGLLGNNMIKRQVREDVVIRLMGGLERVHYLLLQRYISIDETIS
jgi:hypothetical protein